MSKSVVSIVKGTEPQEMVEAALDHLGGVTSLIRPDSTVVIKPNAGHVAGPETAVNTSPAVVTAAITALRKAKPKQIILAEASAIGCDTMECLESSGIAQAAREAGVDRIVDIKSEENLIEVPIEDPKSDIKKIMLPPFLIEADHIVNLPIFKSHVSMVFSCALKNIKGVVQDAVHYLMHQTNLAAAMMDQWSVVQPDLTIADLIRPMEGFGPHSGTPTEFGCIVASKDPVALDATVCRMVGLDIDKVDYFEAALDRGLGNVDESQVQIRGNSIEEVFKPLYLPYLEGFDRWPDYGFYVEHACSTCQGLLAFTMTKLEALGEYQKNKGLNIVIGRKKQVPETLQGDKEVILMGDCVKGLKKRIEKLDGGYLFIPGCPPVEAFPYWTIVDREEQPSESMTQDLAKARQRAETEGEAMAEWLKNREKE
jgi:uncharacterized protein (DUF362 family)